MWGPRTWEACQVGDAFVRLASHSLSVLGAGVIGLSPLPGNKQCL